MVAYNKLHFFIPVFVNTSSFSNKGFKLASSVDFFFNGSFLFASSDFFWVKKYLFIQFPLYKVLGNFVFESLFKIFFEKESTSSFICAHWEKKRTMSSFSYFLYGLEMISSGDFMAMKSHKFCVSNTFSKGLIFEDLGDSFSSHFSFLDALPFFHASRQFSFGFSCEKEGLKGLRIRFSRLQRKFSEARVRNKLIRKKALRLFILHALFKLLWDQKILASQFKKLKRRLYKLEDSKKLISFLKGLKKKKSLSSLKKKALLQPVIPDSFAFQYRLPIALDAFQNLSFVQKDTLRKDFCKAKPQFKDLSPTQLLEQLIYHQWIY